MRYLIKKYWKYIFIIISIILVFMGSYVYYENSYIVKADNIKKLDNSVTKKKDVINKEVINNDTVFVDIKGAVLNPGVYEIENGKRIIDVINKAGGLTKDANVINLNLSKKVNDEMFIIVYTKEEIDYYFKNNTTSKEIVCASKECVCPDVKNDAYVKSKSVIKENNSSNKISINKASKEELMSLTGIGDSKANAIIKYRQENGEFKSLEDIKLVSGIGDSVYEKIKNEIVL